MKPNVRLVIFGAFLGAATCAFVSIVGCATTSKVTAPVIATVKDCADAVTHSVTLGILDDISSILVCDGGNAAALPGCVISQLVAIAKTSGWAAVDCAIAEIQQKAAGNVAASNDNTEYLRVRRAVAAQEWRAVGGGGS